MGRRRSLCANWLVETKIETDLPAYIPDTYVEDDRQRVIFYKRLVELRDAEGARQLELEPGSVILLDIGPGRTRW